MIKRIIVHGKVQGVFFRQSCKEEAERIGVVGFVRNLPDGRVEIVAGGTASQLEQFILWCRRGPRLAHVKAVDVSDISGSELHDDANKFNRLMFVIR